jgi:hypothetical protein
MPVLRLLIWERNRPAADAREVVVINSKRVESGAVVRGIERGKPRRATDLPGFRPGRPGD